MEFLAGQGFDFNKWVSTLAPEAPATQDSSKQGKSSAELASTTKHAANALATSVVRCRCHVQSWTFCLAP